jgi:hypothetical protein
MKRKVTSAWMDGFIEGITLYAHWEDGTQYVGTTGKTLNQAIDDAYTEVVVVSREEPIGPRRVCLCGSTRFYEAFQRANYEETMAGRIVLSVGFYPHSTTPPRRSSWTSFTCGRSTWPTRSSF